MISRLQKGQSIANSKPYITACQTSSGIFNRCDFIRWFIINHSTSRDKLSLKNRNKIRTAKQKNRDFKERFDINLNLKSLKNNRSPSSKVQITNGIPENSDTYSNYLALDLYDIQQMYSNISQEKALK